MIELTADHLRLASALAQAVYRRLPKAAAIDLSDLESEANFGLFQASLRFKEQFGSFERFARYRIRGAILDYLRQRDSIGRIARNRIKQSADPDYQRWFNVECLPFLASTEPTPEQVAIRAQESESMRKIIGSLPSKEQTLIKLRHQEELTQLQVALSWNVTHGRVAQIERSLHDRLRGYICSPSQRSRNLHLTAKERDRKKIEYMSDISTPLGRTR